MTVKRLFTLLAFLTGLTVAYGQQINAKRLVEVKLQLADGSTHSGYLYGLDESGIELYHPFDSLGFHHYSSADIHQVIYSRRGSFLSGYAIGAGLAESMVLITAFGQESDLFGIASTIAFGTFYVMIPTGLVFGLVDASQNLSILSEVDGCSDSLMLATRWLKSYVPDTKDIPIIKDRSLKRLKRLQFPEGSQRQRMAPCYAPRFHVKVVAFGPYFYNFDSQMLNHFPDWFPDGSKDKANALDYFWDFGLSYSPNSRWEFGYEYQPGFYGAAYLDQRGPVDGAEFSYEFSQHQFYALRRILAYHNGFGSQWQLAFGSGLSLLDGYYDGSISEFNGSGDDFQFSKVTLGLTVYGNAEYFFSRNVSIQVQAEFSSFLPVKTKELQGENARLAPVPIRSNFTTLSGGMRIHL